VGYKPKRTVYKLDFSETEYAGLEVAMRAGSIDALLGLQELADQGQMTADEAKKMFAGFAGLLESWNVEDDDDRPVPATYEGVASQEPGFIGAIVRAFFANVAAAPPPLPGGSLSGGTSAAESTLGLDAASRSLQS
jgi:hypothetical protein